MVNLVKITNELFHYDNIIFLDQIFKLVKTYNYSKLNFIVSSLKNKYQDFIDISFL